MRRKRKKAKAVVQFSVLLDSPSTSQFLVHMTGQGLVDWVRS